MSLFSILKFVVSYPLDMIDWVDPKPRHPSMLLARSTRSQPLMVSTRILENPFVFFFFFHVTTTIDCTLLPCRILHFERNVLLILLQLRVVPLKSLFAVASMLPGSAFPSAMDPLAEALYTESPWDTSSSTLCYVFAC